MVVVVEVGHSDISHTPAFVEFPGQFSSPPKTGSLQARALSQVPRPHEALHSDHSPHACHSAFSAARIFLVGEKYEEFKASRYLRIPRSGTDRPLWNSPNIAGLLQRGLRRCKLRRKLRRTLELSLEILHRRRPCNQTSRPILATQQLWWQYYQITR